MAAGNFGDGEPTVKGVWELRMDWGPGESVHYALAGKRLVLLHAANVRDDCDTAARTPPALFGARVTNGRCRVGVGALNLGDLPTDCLQASEK